MNSCIGHKRGCAVILDTGKKAASAQLVEINEPAANVPAAHMSAKKLFISPSGLECPHPVRLRLLFYYANHSPLS